MSMLSEPRKKVKYFISPREPSWLNDDDKFGQKLMEKFGWQKGKGLGANETGRVENVKASGKNDTKGFGFKKTNNDNWICHQDDFNSLLSELNASHGSTGQENEEKVISLEEKSKAAKKRVHYHKQAKGKDLSQRSSEDLDCIFGRKKSKMPKEETEVLQTEEIKDAPEESNHGITTIRSNQSIQEYFAMKLAQIKSKKNIGQHLSANEVPQKDEMEQDEPAEVPASEETSLADLKAMGSNEEKRENVGEKSKKKKKKKSKEKEKLVKEEEGEEAAAEEEEVAAVEEEGGGCCYNSPLELKENVDSNESNEADENLSSKKARKSKRKKRSKEYTNNATESGEVTETVMEEIPVVEEDNKMEAGETNLITKPKKKKRDKKCKDEISEPETRAVDSEILKDSSVCDRKVCKSIKAETTDINFVTVKKEVPDEEFDVVESEMTTKPKKSKKNKRIKDESETVDNATAECDAQDNKPVAFDVDNNSSSNASRVVDNNDEETVASPPKKKKKKKSSKKSKSEADEDEDALTAADCSAIQKTEPQISGLSETQESEQSSVSGSYASWGNYDASNSSSKNSRHLIPENKQDIKRSPYAVHTATKIFKGVGANVDKICGYGYSME